MAEFPADHREYLEASHNVFSLDEFPVSDVAEDEYVRLVFDRSVVQGRVYEVSITSKNAAEYGYPESVTMDVYRVKLDAPDGLYRLIAVVADGLCIRPDVDRAGVEALEAESPSWSAVEMDVVGLESLT